MTLEDEALVQLVAEIANGRQTDFLERVFGEERRKGAQKDDDQHRDQEVAKPRLAIRLAPPVVKLTVDPIGLICNPGALAYWLIPLEDGIDNTVLCPFLP